CRMCNSTFNEDYQLLLRIMKEHRKAHSFTQKVLAQRVGISQSKMSKLERGERRIDPVEFTELGEAMEANPLKLYATFLRRRKKAGAHPKLRRKPKKQS